MAKKTDQPENDKKQLSEEAQALIKKGKEKGFLSEEDIAEVIPDPEENVEELDDLYAAIIDNGVDLAEQPRVDEAPWEEISEVEEVVVETKDDEYIKDIADDSVRLYLREIGKILLRSLPGQG